MNGLFTQSGVLVGFEFSGDVGLRFSERILKRCIEEVAIFVAAGLFDKSSAGEEAVARVALEMAGEVVGREQVGLRADVERPGAGSRAQQHAGFVVGAIAIGRPPEQILLQRKRKIVHGGHRDACAGTDDVLPPDVVDVAKIRMAVGIELIEGANHSAGLLISDGVIELQVHTRFKVFDRQGVAKDEGEYYRTDELVPDASKLPRRFDLKVQVSLTNLARSACADGLDRKSVV